MPRLRPPKRTPAQEEAIEFADKLNSKSEILQRGVAAMLNQGESYCYTNLPACIEMLQEAMTYRRQAKEQHHKAEQQQAKGTRHAR